MERLGTCGVCEFYGDKIDYTDCSEGQCCVDGPGKGKWTSSRDTCVRHKEHSELAIRELQSGLEEIQARLKGFRQRIDDCKAQIANDGELIRQVTPREAELLAELEKRGVVEEDDGDDD